MTVAVLFPGSHVSPLVTAGLVVLSGVAFAIGFGASRRTVSGIVLAAGLATGLAATDTQPKPDAPIPCSCSLLQCLTIGCYSGLAPHGTPAPLP